MSAGPRTLKLTYGTYVVGGDSDDALLDGGYQIVGSSDADGNAVDVVTFAAIILSNTDLNWAIKVQAFETAFSTPRLKLTATQNSAILLSRDPAAGSSGNTGFNAAPSYRKDQHAADTGRSRRYLVTITIPRPTTLSTSGRRSASYSVDYDTSRRIVVTFRGQYTAVGANDAKAQYDSASGTYFAAVLAGITGTFEKVREETKLDDAGKVLDYVVVYHEILFRQTASAVDDTNIVEHSVSFAKALDAPGDWGADTVRLTDVLATYECSVNKADTAIEALYRGSLRQFVVDQAQEAFSPIQMTVENESVTFDRTQNKIAAVLRIKMAIGTSNLIAADVEQELTDDPGKVFTEPWDGQALSAYVDAGPGARYRRTTKRFLVLGGASLKKWISGGGPEVDFGVLPTNGGNATGGGERIAVGPPGGSPGGPGYVDAGVDVGGSSSTGWQLLPSSSSVAPKSIGMTLDGGKQITVTLYTETKNERYVVKPKGGRASPGVGDGQRIVGPPAPGSPGGAVTG